MLPPHGLDRADSGHGGSNSSTSPTNSLDMMPPMVPFSGHDTGPAYQDHPMAGHLGPGGDHPPPDSEYDFSEECHQPIEGKV